MTLKPCIECGKDCEILPVQLGDFFTLTYLRVCGSECMFLIAYEFMRENCEHKQFRNKLHNMQNEEDKAERDAYVEEVTNESLKMMREHLQANPDLLSRPVPNLISEAFVNSPGIQQCSGETMRFTRPKLEDRIEWAREHLKRTEKAAAEALDDLHKLIDERWANIDEP